MEELQAAFDDIATQLRALDALVEQGSVWGDDYEICERATALVETLETAVSVVGRSPEAALALCRVGIEHQALDSLIMLADKTRVSYHNVPRGEYEQWRKSIDEKVIEEIEYVNGDLSFVRGSGRVPATGDRPAEPISQYHRINRVYVPGMPTPNDAAGLLWPRAGDDFDNWLKVNQKSYNRHWKWGAIQGNLQLNGLVSDEHLLQLRVHYAFLSQFVHAYPNAMFQRRAAIASREAKARFRAREIVLCYGLTLLRLEANCFLEFCRRRERLEHVDTSVLARSAQVAERVSSYFWFLGGGPTSSDRRTESDQRSWHAAGFSKRPSGGEFGPLTPTELQEADIHYYSDPWARLPQVSPYTP